MGDHESHWRFAGEALVGVDFGRQAENGGFGPDAFSIRTITHDRSGLTLVVTYDGAHLIGLRAEGRDVGSIHFKGGTFWMSYARAGDQLEMYTDDLQPDAVTGLRYLRTITPRAPELEKADREFAQATSARGIAGWVAWFDEHGGMWGEDADERVEGQDAIREFMGPLLAQPGLRLEWHPLASGLAPGGRLGYTIGAYQADRLKTSGQRELLHRGPYAIVWKRQADGTWRVLFYASRAVDLPKR